MGRQLGNLIIARHAIDDRGAQSADWREQIEVLSSKIQPLLPSDPMTQSRILTSPSPRAFRTAMAVGFNFLMPVKETSLLSLDGRDRAHPKQVFNGVLDAMRHRRLVVVVSHEPICERLAVSTMYFITCKEVGAPSFRRYTSALLIQPDQLMKLADEEDTVPEWDYLKPA